MNYCDIEYDDLPNDELKFIYDECGAKTARDFMKYFAGMVVYIPTRIVSVTPSIDMMWQIFGKDETQRIIQCVGGMKVYIPVNMSTEFVDQYVKKNIGRKSVIEIANDLGMSIRTIYKSLKRQGGRNGSNR